MRFVLKNSAPEMNFCHEFFCYYYLFFVSNRQISLRILRGADLCMPRNFTELILIVAISAENKATERSSINRYFGMCAPN